MAFEHPQILYALWALLIPIVVHLFLLRPYKKLYFTHVDLLKNIEAVRRKPSQLRERILLAVRLFLILFLVLAFAKPIWRQPDKLSGFTANKRVAIYVDNSFSMTRQGSEATLLDEAKNKALSVVDSYPPDTRFLLLLNQDNPALNTWLYKSDFKKRLAKVQAVYQQKTGMQLQRAITASLANTPYVPLHHYVISDFQQPQLLSPHLVADSSRQLRLCPVAASVVDNISIDSMSFSTVSRRANSAIGIRVFVSNHSRQARKQLTLRLYVDGEQRALKQLNIAAVDTLIVPLSFTMHKAGNYKATISIDEDAVVFDNSLHFTFELQDKWRVGAMYHKQLNPYLIALLQMNEQIDFVSFEATKAPYHQWSALDLLILDALPDCSTGCWAEIESYLTGGGHVLLLPSVEKAARQRWNSLLQSKAWPYYAPLDSLPVDMAKIDIYHNFFQDVFVQQLAQDKHLKKAMPKVFRSYPLQWTATKGAQVLLQSRAGHAMLSYVPVQHIGALYQLAFPLQLSFSDLPEYALMVPLLYQMIWQQPKQQQPYYTIGHHKAGSMPLRLPLHQQQSKIEIQGDEPADRWLMDYNSRSAILRLGQLPVQQASHYGLYANDSLLQWVAFNYSRDESNMLLSPDSLLQSFVEQYPTVAEPVLGAESTLNLPSLAKNKSANNIWYYLLLITFCIIFVEVLVIAFWPKT